MNKGISRRDFLKGTIAGAFFSILNPFHRLTKGQENPCSPLFWIQDVPIQPFYPGENDNRHTGIDALLQLMGENGLKFYRSLQETELSGPSGMIQPDDIVLIKVNAQWKYRGCTNSDLIRGLIQSILDHPDGFRGEVAIFENGQGRGSLHCENTGSNYPDGEVHANANDEIQSFSYLVNNIFNDPRVSLYLLDPVRGTFIGTDDHVTDGYRKYENVSYPCFTTTGGHRVELFEGIWQGSGYSQNLKLINVPVLKYHDTGGSEITASLKHFYGIVSMADGYSNFRHYSGLGETCGKMFVSVRAPVLNIIDAIWVSFSSLSGYPANTTFRANQILACQDPVALDYWAAKYILYPISNNSRHFPTAGGIIDRWLTNARDMINGRGGLYEPESGILIETTTKDEQQMLTHVFAFDEIVSAPDIPQGTADGMTGTIYTYTTSGSISSAGDPVQYLFDWGDGTNSGWLPVGTSSAKKIWVSPGTYEVRTQARCSSHPSIISTVSDPHPVSIVPSVITLQSPSNGGVFYACSLTTKYQPTFSWSPIGTYTGYKILFSTSPTDFITRGIVISTANISATSNSWTPSKRVWKKIMMSSYNNGGIRDVYWKVIGKRTDQATVESEGRSFRIGGPQAGTIHAPLDGAALSSTTPPIFNFNSNCNIKFRLEFSLLSDFSDPKQVKWFIYTTKDPNIETTIQKTLTSSQWTAVKKLISTGQGYFRIKAWDGIKREAISEVRSFMIQ